MTRIHQAADLHNHGPLSAKPTDSTDGTKTGKRTDEVTEGKPTDPTDGTKVGKKSTT